MATEEFIPVRDQLIEYLKTLPINISLDEILYHLHVRKQIEDAQEEIKHGNVYTTEQARELLKKWL
jgi:hypothetical protein